MRRSRVLLVAGNVCAFAFTAGILVWVATGRFGAASGSFLFAAIALWALHAVVNPRARFAGFKDAGLPTVLGALVLLFLVLLVIFAAVNNP